uniref:Acid phosphatase n=1 Tax=Panagrellus redivivus TaxID=6233 RepID=A0A7E4WDS5_PANRE
MLVIGVIVAVVAACGGLARADDGDKLIHVDTVYRHGDRAPLSTYRNDPYGDDAWPQGRGQLSVLGMSQHYLQGLRVRDRYIRDLKFLKPNYAHQQVAARSTDTDRTLTSAYSQLAAIYSGSDNGFPSTQNGWPTHWVPVPVHTVDISTEHLLDADVQCPRMDQKKKEAVQNPVYQAFMDQHAFMFKTISANAGQAITEINGLRGFYDVIFCERYNNKTLPAWITDELYEEIATVALTADNYIFGSAGFDRDEELEMIRLRTGVLIEHICSQFQNSANRGGDYTMTMYSAHDTTVGGILRSIGAKEAVIGIGMPEYASLVAFELWQTSSNDHYVKVYYVDNAYSPFRDITQYIGGCGGNSKCPLDTFITRSKPYRATDNEILDLCKAK